MRDAKVAAMMFGLVMSSTFAGAEEARHPIDVTLQVEDGCQLPALTNLVARDTVKFIFAQIGVRTAWIANKLVPSSAYASTVEIHVRFSPQATDKASSDAMAYSFPFAQGTKDIIIFCDRIRLASGGWPREPYLLAYVLAHEIGHILEVSDGHSQSGIMKAHFSLRDLEAMRAKALEFSSGDVEMIRQGLSHVVAGVRYHSS